MKNFMMGLYVALILLSVGLAFVDRDLALIAFAASGIASIDVRRKEDARLTFVVILWCIASVFVSGWLMTVATVALVVGLLAGMLKGSRVSWRVVRGGAEDVGHGKTAS